MTLARHSPRHAFVAKQLFHKALEIIPSRPKAVKLLLIIADWNFSEGKLAKPAGSAPSPLSHHALTPWIGHRMAQIE